MLNQVVKKNKGTTTIEACYLIPFSIMIILTMIFMGIYLYNRTTMTDAISIAVLDASANATMDNDDLLLLMEMRAAELLSGKLILVNEVNLEGTVSYNKVSLKAEATFDVPGEIFLTDGYFADKWSLNTEKEAPRVRRSMVVRTMKRMANSIGRRIDS